MLSGKRPCAEEEEARRRGSTLCDTRCQGDFGLHANLMQQSAALAFTCYPLWEHQGRSQWQSPAGLYRRQSTAWASISACRQASGVNSPDLGQGLLKMGGVPGGGESDGEQKVLDELVVPNHSVAHGAWHNSAAELPYDRLNLLTSYD